jgi:hypothetical protein
MSNPNYAGVSNEVLIKKLNDNLDHIYDFPSEEYPTGPAADYFLDDVWREVYALQIELKLRGVVFDAYGERPIQ